VGPTTLTNHPTTTCAGCAGRLGLIFLVLLAAYLCGCSPVADSPDSVLAAVANARHKHLKFADAQGPLSNARGKMLIAQLEKTSGKTDILKRHLAFEQAISGSPLSVGNKVTLLENGADTYRAMFNAIEGADDNINLETFEFMDDPIGQEFADALIAKQRAGVQVNVIYDSFGSWDTPAAFFQRMRESGIRVLQFDPLSPAARRFHWATAHRDHRKLMIVDGRTAFLGGINLSDVYSSSPSSESAERKSNVPQTDLGSWRDTDIEIEGPAVAECQKLFIEHWMSQRGRPLSPRRYFAALSEQGNDIVRIIGFAPGELSLIYVTLISAINNAETNVYITDAYFAPDARMLDAMESAARRGVDVKLLVPGASTSSLVQAAGRSHYLNLLNAGVKVYEWRGNMLHAKTATIDHVWSTVGSSNLDWWSIARNDEVNATILSAGFGQEMDRMFGRDLRNATEIDPEQWKSRSVFERIYESFARMIQPML
jgi:cardiolipin synthase A/B